MLKSKLTVTLDPGTGTELYEFVTSVDQLEEDIVKFFRRVMRVSDFSDYGISRAMMSTVFGEDCDRDQMRDLCREYDLVMKEDIGGESPMDTVMGNLSDDSGVWEITDPHGTIVSSGDTSNHPSWEERYWKLYRRFQKFARFTDEELNQMVENHNSIPATPGSYRRLYQENLDLKAKLSRLENPDAPHYTDEEIDAMSYEDEWENDKYVGKIHDDGVS